MYIPKHFAESDERALWRFIDEHAFGTLLTVADGRPFASHVPFRAEPNRGVLHCHLARANPQWRQLVESPHALVIFMGPHGYISPTWYRDYALPTWNYAVVHAHGTASIVDDREHTRRHVEALAAKFERHLAEPWTPSYDERKLEGIVGVEIGVSKLEGKFKLGQNRTARDREGVVAALRASNRDGDAALAEMMAALAPDT